MPRDIQHGRDRLRMRRQREHRAGVMREDILQEGQKAHITCRGRFALVRLPQRVRLREAPFDAVCRVPALYIRGRGALVAGVQAYGFAEELFWLTPASPCILWETRGGGPRG